MGMYSVIKGLFSLSLLVLIAGVLQGSFMVGVLCALFFAIPACILFFVLYTREKREAENAKRDLASKLSAKQEKCNTVLPNVKRYMTIFSIQWAAMKTKRKSGF